MINFALEPELERLRARSSAFVREMIIPMEAQVDWRAVGITDELCQELQEKGRLSGLFNPNVSIELGGLGLDMRGQAIVFEELGYSLLGALALNCAPPDGPNQVLLAALANSEQRDRYLTPLLSGVSRSCFAMTEPPPGAGSDPRMMRSRARRVPGGWVLDGHKWWITGAIGATFAICVARTNEPSDEYALTLFLIDANNPGFQIVRDIDSLHEELGGHAEIVIENCSVSDDAVLGQIGRGHEYIQLRLEAARLGHCMRYIGLARRAQDVAIEYAARRESSGTTLSNLGMIQQLIADNEIDLAAARALTWRAAWVVDCNGDSRLETSITKTFVSEAVNRVVDRSVQVCGGLGVSGDTQLALYFRTLRPFRIYDGASEVHRSFIARSRFRQYQREVDGQNSSTA